MCAAIRYFMVVYLFSVLRVSSITLSLAVCTISLNLILRPLYMASLCLQIFEELSECQFAVHC